MDYLQVPNSNIKLVDGSVVILARLPNIKCVVHYGWYDYQGVRSIGWYFTFIPTQVVAPVTESDLQSITLVDPSEDEQYPIPPAPWPPYSPAVFSKYDEYLLNSAFISVPTIQTRDDLVTNIPGLPNGKLVRVNNVEGAVKYYSWDAIEQIWIETHFEFDPADYYTREEVDTQINSVKSDVSDLILVAQNVVIQVEDWVSSEDEDYPYKAIINITEVTTDYVAIAQFLESDKTSYEIRPQVEVGPGTVTVYCKIAPSIDVDVPSIFCFKGTVVPTN